MPINIKNAEQIEQMRRAGRLVASIVDSMKAAVEPGVTTREIDDVARDGLVAAGAIAPLSTNASFRCVDGPPAHSCISVNDEVLHGSPGPRRLEDGDVVTLDVGLSLDGYFASRAVTVAVGIFGPEVGRLLRVTDDVLAAAIAKMGPGVRWHDVARLIQSTIEGAGYHVVRHFVGHGIGVRMFEDPKIPNFTTRKVVGEKPLILRPGMTFTVEPMVLSKGSAIHMSDDGHTILADDGRPAAHARHTVAINASGTEVLTVATT